jgi:TorA maturation chaperone TorD
MSDAAPPRLAPALPEPEAARANFYALLARLFYAPPEARLLESIASAATPEAEGGGIGPAWRDLARAAAAARAEAVREEYESVFVGTGKAPVTLYTSAYTIRHTSDAPLAELRGELASLGLARRREASEPEDHVAALFDTMRHLIATREADLAEQKRFFERWIRPAIEPLCNAIARDPNTVFYRAVGSFALSFCTVEHTAFEML